MNLVPKHQEFFYIVVVSTLVIMASLIVVIAQKSKNPQYATSKASESLQSDDMPYEVTESDLYE
jgi:hypothetical protein